MEEYRRLCRWESNIKMTLKEIDVVVMTPKDDWRALVNVTLNFRVS